MYNCDKNTKDKESRIGLKVDDSKTETDSLKEVIRTIASESVLLKRTTSDSLF